MQLVDDHVREVGGAEAGVVPGIGIDGTQDAEAIWEARGRQLARVGVALVAAAPCTDYPVAIGVSIGSAGLEPVQ